MNIGISRLVPVRVNPYQPSSFTCYVEGVPLPDASSVDLYRRTGSTYNKTGITRRSSAVSGSERAVVFDVDSVYTQEYGGYVCIITVENVGYPSTPNTNATYVLPVIGKAPVIVSTTSTTVGLRWNAWSEEDDIGDPPLHLPSESAECRSGVTHYMIYYASTGSTLLDSLMVPNDTSSYTIRGIDTYLEYTVQITASNKDEESDRSRETIGKTIEEVAPSPINVAIPRSTTSSFTVSWSTPLPSNINGNIQKYIIRYKRTDLVTDGGYKMEEVLNGAFEGQHTVIDLIAKTIYSVQRTDPVTDGGYKMEEVLTGAFEGEHTVIDLIAKTIYLVQVLTVNGAGFSNWSESVNAKTTQAGGSPSAPLGAILGGVMATLIIIILVIILILVIFRRMKQRRLKAEPAASPPNNARETSSKYENPVFDDSNQDPNTYEDINTDTNIYQDLNTDTPNYKNLIEPHTYQDLKKPNTDVTYLKAITSDPRDIYEEI
eukprot:XP_011670068.1 PREDICTED: uncharacterized protein LOC100892459 [Strongylocentrotus purpuratus]